MPSPSENSDAVRRLIETQLAQLEQEAEALRRALDALGAPAPASRSAASRPAGQDPTEPASTKPRPGGRRRRRRARSSTPAAVIPAGKLEALLGAADGDGLSTAALAQETGGDADQVRTLLRELEEAGRVRRTGQRRGTRWHRVTEEDLVAERAAQLAAQRRETAAEEAAAMEAYANAPAEAAADVRDEVSI